MRAESIRRSGRLGLLKADQATTELAEPYVDDDERQPSKKNGQGPLPIRSLAVPNAAYRVVADHSDLCQLLL